MLLWVHVHVHPTAAHGALATVCLRCLLLLWQFVVTDTVPLRQEALDSPKVVQLSVAPLLATAIKRMHRRQSLQDLRVYSRQSAADRYAGQLS